MTMVSPRIALLSGDHFTDIAGRRIEVEASTIVPGKQRRYYKPTPPSPPTTKEGDKSDPKNSAAKNDGENETDSGFGEDEEFYYCYACQDVWELDEYANVLDFGCPFCGSSDITIVEMKDGVVETSLTPFFNQ